MPLMFRFFLFITSFIIFPLITYSTADDYDIHGGWKQISSEPKSYFYVQLINGTWWLVSPEGNVFFSKGVNHVSYTADHSPALGYSPYGRLTQMKYQTEDDWAKATADRLRSWYFNTVGAWSSARMQQQNLAYTINLSLAEGAGGNWQYGVFPDVFSPAFQRSVESAAAAKCRPHKENPYLLGYFTDNELRWGPDWRSKNPLIIDFLALPADAPGHAAAVSFLRKKYENINDLNQAWKITASTFEAIPKVLSIPTTRAYTDDQKAFLFLVADQYFRVCYDAIQKEDPNHMVLGVRFAGLAPEPVLKALRDYVDVVSFNTYNFRPPIDTLTEIHQITGRPLMITEFSFKAMDSGLPNTKGAGTPVKTQQDRADNFTRFVTDLAKLPFMVGYHWFEYTDEPKEGRFDGENSNYGLVNIADEPWEILTQDMTRTNQEIESIHRGTSEVK